MYRFPVADNDAFIHYALQSGRIQFVVRGNIECDATFTFVPFGLRVGSPTKPLRVVAENPDHSEADDIYIHELHEETVFPGEIDLPERTVQGISHALATLELWADFMCLNFLNRKISIEVQQPIQIRMNASRPKLEFRALERGSILIETYMQLPAHEQELTSKALWWYRKGCIAQHYSVFESYTAYWNCLEILSGVSASKIRQGPEVDAEIQHYLAGKQIRSSHILHCYNQIVNYSIRRQMEDALKTLLDADHAEQCINQCFRVKPETKRLYQIRNDINHGNIRENNSSDYLRVYLRGMLLWQITMHILYRRLGYPIGPRPDFDKLATSIEAPFVDQQ